jgi:hypothetical protein
VPYPRGFCVPDFSKFTREDSKTAYEHIGQFLAQVSDFGINDVHKNGIQLACVPAREFN